MHIAEDGAPQRTFTMYTADKTDQFLFGKKFSKR